MRKQNNQGYEIYNTFKRDPIGNDWAVLPRILAIAVLLCILYKYVV